MDNIVIILNYNDFETTSELMHKIKNYTEIDKIIVVDNNSTDESFEALSKYSSEKIHVIKSGANKGYAYGNNIGIKYALNNFHPQFITISNPDVVFEDCTLKKMKQYLFNNADVAAVNVKIININGTYEKSGWKLPNLVEDIKSMFLFNKLIDKLKNRKYGICSNEKIIYQDVLSGCFFMIRAEVMKKVGFLDERTFLFGEERILGYKIKQIGLKQATLNYQKCIHEHSTTINKNISSEIKKYVILYDSRVIYYKEYLHVSNLGMLLFKILKPMSLLEKYVYVILKNILMQRNKINGIKKE